MKAEIIHETERIVGKDRVLLNEPLSAHTTFKTGGPAEIFAMPQNTEALTGLILFLKVKEFLILSSETEAMFLREIRALRELLSGLPSIIPR